MKSHLYAPWRSSYTAKIARTKNETAKEEECVFCSQLKQQKDTSNFIFRRFNHNAVMFNRYPYNAGHLLIIPFAHKGSLDQLSKEARTEIMELITVSIDILKKVLHAEGVNVGFNLGKAAGAGIPAHLHIHVLPRWTGDTNFLPTIAETKSISFDLPEMFAQLKPAFDEASL